MAKKTTVSADGKERVLCPDGYTRITTCVEETRWGLLKAAALAEGATMSDYVNEGLALVFEQKKDVLRKKLGL